MIKAKIWRGGVTRYAHYKLDGMTLSVKWNGESPISELEAWTRTPKNIAHKVRSLGWFKEIYKRLPEDCTVHGELYVPGRKASQVSSALAHDPGKLRFCGFAIEGPGFAHDLPLKTVNYVLTGWGCETAPYLVQESLKHEGLGGIGRYTSPDELIKLPLPNDAEGYMLKDGNLERWFKLKRTYTIDLIVKGYRDASLSGKHFGLVGSIRAETAEGVEVANVSGMDDLTRLDLSEDGDKYIGRVMEVSYQYVGDKGRLRHPNFVRWREDKPAAECTLSQDDDLVYYWKES